MGELYGKKLEAMLRQHSSFIDIPDLFSIESDLIAQDESSARPSLRVRTPTENKTIGEGFMVKEESETSVGTRPWTPEGRSVTLSIVFML
ncbi:hypothetical protein AVEN_268665-1 [Araneus ventricosus]|uniref:Uncharacterized protein n=1 Tax=Araneus ventricosus TaxID=182803 RepID=A0A4Y2N696_ARAVE|nr:hypothetical protein AVEN_268665-1 [Araneus ventricosus]